MRLAILASLLTIALTACGGDGDPVPNPTFAELRVEYDALEERIFPGNRTDPQNLPPIGGVYDGNAVLAYYRDGNDFTETGAAQIKLFVDFIEDDIAGEVTVFRLESASPVTGQLNVVISPIVGHDFEADLSGDLVIGGEAVTVEGGIDGSFYTQRGASEQGGFAYGNISFTAGPGSHSFGGTFAAER